MIVVAQPKPARPTWRRRSGESPVVHVLRLAGTVTLIIVFSPIAGVSLAAVLLFLLAFVPVALIWYPIRSGVQDAALRRRLRRAQRLISADEVIVRLERGEGTLLAQSVEPGWRGSRLWWTPDRVLDVAPAPALLRRVPEWRGWASTRFLDWCEARYIEEPAGRALMLDLSRRKACRLGKRVWNARCAIEVIGLCAVEAWDLGDHSTRPRHCKRCGYDLVGLEGEVCPECGGPIREAQTALSA